MFGKKRINRKPDPMMLMTLLVGLSVFMTTAVDAGETFFSNPNLSDLINGDIKLTEVGHRGAGLHMSFQTPLDDVSSAKPGNRDVDQNVAAADVVLSLRIPW